MKARPDDPKYARWGTPWSLTRTVAQLLGMAWLVGTWPGTSAAAALPNSSVGVVGKRGAALEVGTYALGVTQVERRLAALPAPQRRLAGKTPRSVKLGLIRDFVLPQLLIEEYAVQQALQTSVNYLDFRKQALERVLLERLQSSEVVSDEEVSRYYQANLGALRGTRAVGLWRILVATEAQAKTLLQSLSSDLTVERWTALAREHSLDEASKFHAGNLGLVAETEPCPAGRRCTDPNLLKAALEVGDATLVPHPVAEGSRFAVIWRRGTRPGRTVDLAQVRQRVREQLAREKLGTRRRALLLALREQHVTQLEPHWVEVFSPPFSLDLQTAPPVNQAQ